jgi:hypothetical protein
MLSWLSAVASFAMLLAVQLTHSPLHHCVNCHGRSCHASSGTTAKSHGHSHASCQHHHAQPSRVANDPCSNDSHPDDSCPGDSHEHCDLCQFLAQAIQPVCLPVELPLHETVELCAPSGEPLVSAVEIAGPYVRGPPLMA